MPPVQSPTSHPSSNGTPMVGLFIIVGAVVVGFPVLIVVALVAKRCLGRRRRDEQRKAQEQLKDFKLQPMPQPLHPTSTQNGGGQSPPDSALRSPTPRRSPSTPIRTSDRARSRLSRPLSMPIRTSILQSQHQSHNTPTPSPENTEALQTSRHLSAVSACSLPSTYTAASVLNSPISPMSSSTPLNHPNPNPQITIPANAHTRESTSRTPRHPTRRDSRWAQRLSNRPFAPLVDLEFGRNLFSAVQAATTTNTHDSEPKPDPFDAKSSPVPKRQVGEKPREESHESAGITIAGVGEKTVQGRDASWQHARLEMVDGVLAPREWL